MSNRMMSQRMSLLVFTILAGLLSWSGLQQAASQPGAEAKQTLVIGYPTPGIHIGGDGKPYQGIIYVKIYAADANLVNEHRAVPLVSTELTASQRNVSTLPLGAYEVHFAMRKGSELNTFILRDIILRADRGNAVTVEMNADAKTTIIGGDMTAQQMASSIRQLQQEVTTLRQDVTTLKGQVTTLQQK